MNDITAQRPQPSGAPSPTSPACAYHAQEPALARCTQCDHEVCHRCYGHDLRGFLVCTKCRERLLYGRGTPWEQPSDEPLVAFFKTLWSALRSPKQFFDVLPEDRPWLPAVVFGIACITAGLLLATMWEFVLFERLDDRLMDLMKGSAMPLPALRAMSFARAPIMAPMIMLFHVLTLHAALLIAGVPAQRKTVARIFGFSCAGYAFLLVPPIGGIPLGYMLAMVWLFNLESSGIQRFYGVGAIKATLIALAPLLLGVSVQCI